MNLLRTGGKRRTLVKGGCSCSHLSNSSAAGRAQVSGYIASRAVRSCVRHFARVQASDGSRPGWCSLFHGRLDGSTQDDYRDGMVVTANKRVVQLPRTAVSFVVGTACEGSTRYWVYRDDASTMALPASPAAHEDDQKLEAKIKANSIYRLPLSKIVESVRQKLAR